MDIWAFFSNPQNQQVLSYIGGGLVVVAGGAWAVIKFFAGRDAHPKPEAAAPARHVTSRDGIAAGANVSISTKQGLTGWQPVLLVLAVAGAVVLAASFAGHRTVATSDSIAIGGSVGGNVINHGSPAPPARQ